MARRRSRRVQILLPDHAEERRRSFLVKGLFGTLLLALGGGAWFARRMTRVAPEATGPLAVFSAEEVSVLLAIADRFVPERAGFPRPRALSIARRIDALAARTDPATQLELRRLVRLFESALTALLIDAQPNVFTASSPAAQDRRLRAWAESRIAVRRTGYRALKRLVYGAYYGAHESWAAVGYPGPPSLESALELQARSAHQRAARASTPAETAGPAPERRSTVPANPAAPDRRATVTAQPTGPDRAAGVPAHPAGSDGQAQAAAQPARPDRRPQPPRRKRAFAPLKPFTEQPLEPAPAPLVTPRGSDG